jgi:high-affinity iron transporter
MMSLNQLLPVAILWVLLQVYSKQPVPIICTALISGLLVSFFYMQASPRLSQLYSQQGLEFSQIMLCVIMFIAVLIFTIKRQTLAFYIAVVSSMTLYLSHYIIYLTSFWQNDDAGISLLIGSILGVGICMSFSILLYFLMHALKRQYGLHVVIILLALNSAAKLLLALDLASQTDWISSTMTVWDLRHILSEQSELGRVLRALIGYEATPNILSAITYFASATVFILLCYHPFKSKDQQ